MRGEIAKETEKCGQWVATSHTPHCSCPVVEHPPLGTSQSETSSERRSSRTVPRGDIMLCYEEKLKLTR